jgi:Protein of unknown function (DUF4232)
MRAADNRTNTRNPPIALAHQPPAATSAKARRRPRSNLGVTIEQPEVHGSRGSHWPCALPWLEQICHARLTEYSADIRSAPRTTRGVDTMLLGRVVLALAVAGLALHTTGCGGGVSDAAKGWNSVRPCRASEVTGSDVGFEGVAAGTLGESFGLHSRQTCYLQGYPRIVPLSKSRHRLKIPVQKWDGTPTRVTLSPKHPAGFILWYINPDIRVPSCKAAFYALRVTLPGDTGPLYISLKQPPFVVCRDGLSTTTIDSGIAPPVRG